MNKAKPNEMVLAIGRETVYERVRYARALLFTLGLLDSQENEKVKKRIEKWNKEFEDREGNNE